MTTGGTAPRDLPQALAEDVAAPGLQPFLAIRLELPDPVYGFSGKGEITIDGVTYTGWQGYASLDKIGETTDGSAKGVKATLHQIPAEFRDDLADQAVRGCLFAIYLGTLDADYQAVRGWKRLWRGTLQGYDIHDMGDELSVTVTGENRAIDQRRPSIKRFTDEYQQGKYPGDRAFEYVHKMAELPVLWAKAKQDAI